MPKSGGGPGYETDTSPITRPSIKVECFVATACYGVDDAVTESLRAWRDRQDSVLSVLFIKAYYAGIGQTGARLLNRFPALKPSARKLIKAFMWAIHIS